MAREFLSKLTASCFPLSSTLSELASLCVKQKGVQGNNGTQVSKYRSGDWLSTGHPLGEKQTAFFSIYLAFI